MTFGIVIKIVILVRVDFLFSNQYLLLNQLTKKCCFLN